MNRWLLLLVAVPLLGLSFAGCSSYRLRPDGYILRGDSCFFSIPGLMVYTGPEFQEDDAWIGGIPPLRTGKLSRKQTGVLRRLGYDRKSYSALFRSNPHSPIDFFAVTNTEPLKKEGSAIRLISTSNLERKTTGQGIWYDSILQKGGRQFYHAVLPVSEELFRERYISLVFPLRKGTNDLEVAEKYVQDNVAWYNGPYMQYYPPRTVTGACPDDEGVDYYYGYFIPDEVLIEDKYKLIAAYRVSPEGKKELIYYRILTGVERMGAFRICPGEYLFEYLSLDGKVHWSTVFSPKPQG